MKLMKDDMPPDRLIFILFPILLSVVFLAFWVVSGIVTPKRPTEPFVSLLQCFYEAPRIPYIPKYQVLGSLVGCLEHYESGGNPLAVGKAGEIGVLQFMPSTFQHFCVEKYGYRNDIWDAGIQRDCAAEMLNDGLIHHWTTRDKCYGY